MDASRYGLELIENVTQESVLDAHSQRPATEHQTEDFSVSDDGGSHQAVIAEAIRYVERKQAGLRISGQRRQFSRGKLAAGGVELSRALEQLLNPSQSLGGRGQTLNPALDLQQFDVPHLVGGLGPQMLPLDLGLDQRAACSGLRGDDR